VTGPIWIDAYLSPALAPWITERFGLEAYSARFLGLRDASDADIFEAASKAKAIVLTKDADFRDLLIRRGPPPHVVWLTFGNTTNARVRKVLERTLIDALELLQTESLVKIGE
jgi:predicted nuclease of predicted toxin-antitoxin system